ncbi:hypothetical protein CC78DRAFT_579694 [Lojkania enalia]|uniref:Uncharacterized protein n=1 Tax=Lojkania enalia TaxID=147567 RepID=A0A9P4N8I8_9PLEO|nr:hypothetical protein CC78DRAFT_579694 [Didymosphaeria enalia]
MISPTDRKDLCIHLNKGDAALTFPSHYFGKVKDAFNRCHHGHAEDNDVDFRTFGFDDNKLNRKSPASMWTILHNNLPYTGQTQQGQYSSNYYYRGMCTMEVDTLIHTRKLSLATFARRMLLCLPIKMSISPDQHVRLEQPFYMKMHLDRAVCRNIVGSNRRLEILAGVRMIP